MIVLMLFLAELANLFPQNWGYLANINPLGAALVVTIVLSVSTTWALLWGMPIEETGWAETLTSLGSWPVVAALLTAYGLPYFWWLLSK